jgi:large subunit ribosomal protein L9
LLEDLKKTGKKGEIVFVSASQYLNVLAPKKSAEKVSDDEMARIIKNAEDSTAAELAAAQEMQAKVKALPVLQIKRKIGDGNKLFGSITNKHVLDIVKSQFPGDAAAPLNAKPVTITEMKGDSADLELSNGEVRKAGTYTVTLKLHSKVDVNLKFAVVPE